MKRTIFIWACLAIFNAAHLQATETDSLTTVSPSNEENTATTPVKSAKVDKEMIAFIPDRNLKLEISNDNKTLFVNLTGDTSEKLDWIIFQPKGAVVGRIESETNFDEIKVSTLDRGDYILMIKDTEGRLLYQPFAIDK